MNKKLQYKAKLAEELKPFLAQLPSNYLGRLAQNMLQLAYFFALREDAQHMGEYLSARFSRKGGNPARRRLLAGEISQYEYEIISAEVDWWNLLYDLIQLSWDDLKRVNSARPQEFPFECERGLFFTILGETYDSRFYQCLESFYQQSPTGDEKSAKAVKASFWSCQHLTNAQYQQLEKLATEPQQSFWFGYAVQFFINLAQQDTVVALKLKDFNSTCARFADLVAQDSTRARKSGTHVSYAWKDNQLLIAKQGSKYVNAIDFLTCS